MFHLSHEEQVNLTRHIMNLLDDWGIGAKDQVALLGLPAETKPRSLHRYHDDTPLPESEETEKRVDHIYAISEALRTTFPRNARVGIIWLHRRNRHFPKFTPAATMVRDGLQGLRRVRAHLDCTYAWDLTGSSQPGASSTAAR